MANEYPKWKHHPKRNSQIVGSPEEEARLGEEWSDKVFPRTPQPLQVTASADSKEGCASCKALGAQMLDLAKEIDRQRTNYTASYGELSAERDAMAKGLEDLLSRHNALVVENAELKQQLAAQQAPTSAAPTSDEGEKQEPAEAEAVPIQEVEPNPVGVAAGPSKSELKRQAAGRKPQAAESGT
jgi:regulator of replication initiation timing